MAVSAIDVNCIVNNLSGHDFDALAKYDPKESILAVITDIHGNAYLEDLSRVHLTCLNRILSWFGFGILANKQIHLKQVVQHLSHTEWATFSYLDHDSDMYKAYLKVCDLASKALCHKWDATLYYKVASIVVEKVVDFEQTFTSWYPRQRFEVFKRLPIHATSKIRDLKVLIQSEIGKCSIYINDEYNKPYSDDEFVDAKKCESLHITACRHVHNQTVMIAPHH